MLTKLLTAFKELGYGILPDTLNPLITQCMPDSLKKWNIELNMVHVIEAFEWFEFDVEFH